MKKQNIQIGDLVKISLPAQYVFVDKDKIPKQNNQFYLVVGVTNHHSYIDWEMGHTKENIFYQQDLRVLINDQIRTFMGSDVVAVKTKSEMKKLAKQNFLKLKQRTILRKKEK